MPSFLILNQALVHLRKQPQTIALTAVLAVAAGMLGFNGAFGDTFGFNSSPEIVTNDEQAYKGHIIVKHFDAEGNLLGYQQTDNIVTFTGKNCSANLIFGAGFLNCTAPALFDDIAITQTAITPTDANTALAGECVPVTCGTGLDQREAGTVTANPAATAGNPAIAQIVATFNMGSAGPTTINAAGLFDTTTSVSGNLFALKAFSTGVALSNGDSLQVTWLITLA